MNHIIHLEGPDKTGKDYIKDMLVKRSKGEYLVIARSYISQIVYNRIYKRAINEEFFWERMYNAYFNLDEKFFLFVCDLAVVAERFVKCNEKDLEITDFSHHQATFFQVIGEANVRGINITICDTSHSDPERTYNEIQGQLIKSEIQYCRDCGLCEREVNKFDFDKGYGPLTPQIHSNKPTFMLVGMNPSNNRIKESRHPFDINQHDQKNLVFLDILQKLNILKRSYITNSVKCSTESNKITEQNFVACNHHLSKEIETFQPDVIIALGADVYKLLVAHKKFKQQIVQIYHPSYQYAYNKITPEDYEQHIISRLKPWL